jgi:hypothetical protein
VSNGLDLDRADDEPDPASRPKGPSALTTSRVKPTSAVTTRTAINIKLPHRPVVLGLLATAQTWGLAPAQSPRRELKIDLAKVSLHYDVVSARSSFPKNDIQGRGFDNGLRVITPQITKQDL